MRPGMPLVHPDAGEDRRQIHPEQCVAIQHPRSQHRQNEHGGGVDEQLARVSAGKSRLSRSAAAPTSSTTHGREQIELRQPCRRHFAFDDVREYLDAGGGPIGVARVSRPALERPAD